MAGVHYAERQFSLAVSVPCVDEEHLSRTARRNQCFATRCYQKGFSRRRRFTKGASPFVLSVTCFLASLNSFSLINEISFYSNRFIIKRSGTIEITDDVTQRAGRQKSGAGTNGVRRRRGRQIAALASESHLRLPGAQPRWDGRLPSCCLA